MKLSSNIRGVFLLSCCFLLSASRTAPEKAVVGNKPIQVLYIHNGDNNLVVIKGDSTVYLAGTQRQDSLALQPVAPSEVQGRIEKRWRSLGSLLKVASAMTMRGANRDPEDAPSSLQGMEILTLDMAPAVADSLGNRTVPVTAAIRTPSAEQLGQQVQTEIAVLRKNYPGIGGQMRRQDR